MKKQLYFLVVNAASVHESAPEAFLVTDINFLQRLFCDSHGCAVSCLVGLGVADEHAGISFGVHLEIEPVIDK